MRQRPTTPVLSVVMPCYNEETTILQIVESVLDSPVVGELIVVDDASTDATSDLLLKISDDRVRIFRQPVNQGKGAALRRAFTEVRFPFTIVQDADLEYDPAEYPKLLEPLLDGSADVVYGSRFRGGEVHRVLYFWHTVGNRAITLVSNMFTNLNLTDIETGYKVFRSEVLGQFTIEEDRFGVEPEITAKVARLGLRVYEVGISYHGRTYAQGKKIGWRDGIRALFCIVAYSRVGEKVRLKRLGPLVNLLTGGRA